MNAPRYKSRAEAIEIASRDTFCTSHFQDYREIQNARAWLKLERLARYGSRRIKSRIRYEARQQRKKGHPPWFDSYYALDLVLERIPF